MPSPFDDVDRLAIVDAIALAEKGNRGEVRVHVEDHCPGSNALMRARELFGELGLHGTQDGTGVLLYVATVDRRAAVFAGIGIHGAASPRMWDRVVVEVTRGFASGNGREGLLKGLACVGDILRKHAPGADTHGNELPDQITHG